MKQTKITINPEASKEDSRLNNCLTVARQCMKDYCLSPDVTRIYIPDTGVIVALILYFIARDYSVCMTKLNGYIVLLDRVIKDNTGEHLFHLDLDGKGLIRNFKYFIEYMINKKLISRRSNHQFNLLRDVLNIKEFPSMFYSIREWLDNVVNDCIFMSAQQLLEHLKNFRQKDNTSTHKVKQRKNNKFASAVNNVNSVIRQNIIQFELRLDDDAYAVPNKKSS